MKKKLPFVMVFLSGFAGLVYQLLWMRQLGLLFGNTAHAAAATLAVFFGGLAVGSWFWGRRVSTRQNPLRDYAWLEVGIALTALLYFGVISLFRLIYPVVYQSTDSHAILFVFKSLLAMMLVFPPAFFMGGTIPVMGQYLIVRQNDFGATSAWMYGINTIGAAVGACLAAFVFVPFLGFNVTCILAMVITGCIATTAFWCSRGVTASAGLADSKKENGKSQNFSVKAKIGRRTIFFLSFLSGFSVLALEVLWTRIFAQIHTNSVYSFATVLVIVLVCLSLGALLASALARTRISARACLSVLMVAGGVMLSFFPMLFLSATGNFTMLSTAGTFSQYVKTLFILGFMTIGPPCLLLGMVFPFLMKSEECFASRPGRSIGYLSAVNTTGAIIGSLLCGFLFLRVIGMWWTVSSIAALYLLVGAVLPAKSQRGGMMLRVLSLVCLLMLFTALNPSSLPVLGADPHRGKHKVLEVWETSDCSVAVIRGELGELAIKLNSNYFLGSTDAVSDQLLQGQIPMFVYPETESVFFLGMGTGMTAGGALDSRAFKSLKRIVVCELVAEVVTAAKRYMTGWKDGIDYTSGLFEDKRVEILVEDGRHYLMATDATFDIINADLFLPYRSGAGSLYSREHYESSLARLNDGGVFVQWLPMFQMTETEFGTISKTMLSVFDQVTLWRNNFMPGKEIVALVGHKGGLPLPSCDMDIGQAKRATIHGKGWRDMTQLMFSCDQKSVTLLYCGNMTASKEMFSHYPINTDDRPIIEYASPRSMRNRRNDMMPHTMVGPRLADLVDHLLENCPPDADPMLANRTPENRRLPLAGAALHRAWIAYAMGLPDVCEDSWEKFVREWTNQGEAGAQ